jgi:hypothetical protein
MLPGWYGFGSAVKAWLEARPNRLQLFVRLAAVHPHRRAFAVHNRPVQGTKDNYRVNLRHGVSRVRSGLRHTVGIIVDAT